MEKITTKVNWTHIKDGKPDIEGPVLVVIHIGGMNPVVTEAYFVDGQFYEDIQAPCLRTCAGLYAWAWKPAAPFWEEEKAMEEDTLKRQLVAFELNGKAYQFIIRHNVPADEIKDIIDTWAHREEDTPTEDLSAESLVRYINSNFSDYYALTAGDRKNRRR